MNKGGMNAIAHYLPTAAQPVPEQQPIGSFSLNLYIEMQQMGFQQVLLNF